MELASLILNYVSPAQNTPQLTLTQTDDEVHVTFPVAPMWVYIGVITIQAICGLVQATGGIWTAVQVHQLFFAFRIPPSSAQLIVLHRLEAQYLISGGLEASFWFGLAGLWWWKLHRWGRFSRSLTANSEGLVDSWLGWWRLRERTYPAAQIERIELRPVTWNLNWKRTVAELYVHRRKVRRLRYRLSSPDPLVPGHVAKQLSIALGRPLDETAR